MRTEVNFDSECVKKDKYFCSLHISMTGEKEAILDRLKEIVAQIEGSYGKPIQGIVCGFKCDSHVITPKWDNQSY